MSLPDTHQTLNVREAMDRIGLVLFPDQWSGKEYLDHWKLGLKLYPATKQRGMAVVQELLMRVWDGSIIVELETSDGVYEKFPAEEVRSFHGVQSSVGDTENYYRPCRLRFPPALQTTSSSKGGRKGYAWPPIVVQILRYIDEHGTANSADHITNAIISEIEKVSKPPSYNSVQPYVMALLAYRCTVEQKFQKSNSGTDGCDPTQNID
jgi:hypothetical protein